MLYRLYRFVGNLTAFLAEKNPLGFEEIIVTLVWRIFWDTVYTVA